MMNILQKARILETKIRVTHETKKLLKKRRYQIFLQQKTGILPGRKKLFRWRRNFILLSMICLTVLMVQTIFYYHTFWDQPQPLKFEQQPTLEQLWKGFLNETPGILGSLFLMLWSFGMAVDWVIHRRWGARYTIIQWNQKI